MKKILKFDRFILEAYVPPSETSGIPVYSGNSFNPVKYVKRRMLLTELENMLQDVSSGSLKSLTVVAEIPTQGKNIPQYIKDIYSKIGYDPDNNMGPDYDPETDAYLGKRGNTGDDVNIFIDSEFVVKKIDKDKGQIIGTPYSLRYKDVMVEINPDKVDEIFIN
jgi:hypothetical protein